MKNENGSKELLALANFVHEQQFRLYNLDKTVKKSVGQQAKQITSQEIRKIAALPQAYLDSKIWVDDGSDVVKVSASRRKTLLSRYQHEQVWEGKAKRGYLVWQRPGVPEHFKHAFEIYLKNSNIMALTQRVGTSRYPIQVLHTNSPSELMEQQMPEIIEQTEKFYIEEINKAIGKAYG